jgi:sugar lactone lactonase YvrE
MTAHTRFFVGAVTALGLVASGPVACGPAETGDEGAESEAPSVVAQADVGPDLVRIEDPELHPEGIEWDAAGDRWLVSSVTRGTVTEVHDDGSHSVFIDDPDIVSSIGIHIDHANGRLLVANSDLASFQGAPGHAKLGAYDLETGERIFMTDLGGLTPGDGQFANDIATGPDGTAYVTNYMTDAIYRVTPSGEATVLVAGEPLAPGGINGIEYHPDGYLIAAQTEARGLIRVGLDGSVTQIAVPEPIAVDGLVFLADGRLAAVANTGEGDTAQTEALLLASTDGWETATIVARWEAASDATTAAVRDGSVYVVDARFALMGGEAPHFDITRARFE